MEEMSCGLARGDALRCVNGEVHEAKVGEMKRLQSEQLQPVLGKDLEDCKRLVSQMQSRKLTFSSTTQTNNCHYSQAT